MQDSTGARRHGTEAQYVVAVDTEDSKAHTNVSSKQVQMLDSRGQGFTCWLPEHLDSTPPLDDENTGQPPSQLLEALSGKCFYKAEEWWQYEVCHNKHVKQFHMEGNALVDEYSLGLFDAAATDLDAIKDGVSEGKGPEAHVSAHYSNGEKCSLVDGHRETEVMFSCSAPGTPDQLTSVKEVSTCSYVLNIATNLLCAHPRLKARPSHFEMITCYRNGDRQEDKEHEGSEQDKKISVGVADQHSSQRILRTPSAAAYQASSREMQNWEEQAHEPSGHRNPLSGHPDDAEEMEFEVA